MQTVIITGCSSGFGLKSAVTLARNNFRVFATMRDPSKRGPLDEALAAARAKADVLALDVTDSASIETAVSAVLAQTGRIDAVVNNAGYAIGGFVEDLTLDDYRRQMDTNFFGLVAVTKAVLPHMRAQRAGRIVNVSSIAGRAANPLVSAYAASKFAVEGFSEALAFEAGLFGVSVILIEPGAFRTEIFDSNRQVAAGARDPNSPYFDLSRRFEAEIDKIVPRIAGDPQKVADAVLHALTITNPRLRYQVGNDAHVMGAVHRFLGFGAYAALVKKYFGWSKLQAQFTAAQERQ